MSSFKWANQQSALKGEIVIGVKSDIIEGTVERIRQIVFHDGRD